MITGPILERVCPPHLKLHSTACMKSFYIAICRLSLRWSRVRPHNPIAPYEFNLVMALAYTSIDKEIPAMHSICYSHMLQSKAHDLSNNYKTCGKLLFLFKFLVKNISYHFHLCSIQVTICSYMIHKLFFCAQHLLP